MYDKIELIAPPVEGWMPMPKWTREWDEAIDLTPVNLNVLVPKAQQFAKDHLGVVDDLLVILWIDPQWDFCHQSGSLFVGGAGGVDGVYDTWRYGRFVCGNVHRIVAMYITEDVHERESIEHAYRLMDREGNSPPPLTMITSDDLRYGDWRVRPEYGEEMQQYYIEYVAAMEKNRGHGLFIWPYHCDEQTIGAMVMPYVKSVAEWWGAIRGKQAEHYRKDGHRDVEFHSIFRPDVRDDRFISSCMPMVEKGIALMESLIQALREGKYVVIGGEAASHCVGWSVDDLIDYILTNYADEASVLLSRIVILTDCTSAIVVRDENGVPIPGPTTDYRPAVEEMYTRWREHGLILTQSTVPVEEWSQG